MSPSSDSGVDLRCSLSVSLINGLLAAIELQELDVAYLGLNQDIGRVYSQLRGRDLGFHTEMLALMASTTSPSRMIT